MWKGGKIASFREKLLAWYDANKRDLPGEGPRILIKFGSQRLCSNRHVLIR